MKIGRVGKASPDVNYLTRCRYAVECIESTSTTWLNQVVELRSMMRGEIEEMERHTPSDKTTPWQVLKEYISYMEERGNRLKSHHRRRDDVQCLFVVEFMEAISAPAQAQVIELELMMQDGEDDDC